MHAVDIIIRKRDKQELSSAEIEFFIKGFTTGEIPDYQASALAMAILLNGMTARETTDLTLAMAHSGETMDLGKLVPVSVDKHSTGGVGDKTSLVVLPVVAACGLPVGKMSGRGLGFSGGTLDKMESIPGYRTDLSPEEFEKQFKAIGLVLTGQSRNLAPADGKLYALRDVTGTVPSLPLIASSIMSKKIAAGSQAILLDVKTGLGAFMETVEEARKLADAMVSIGEMAGRRVTALISDMNQPLGFAVGNSLEVKEALETLQGQGPKDFREHCMEVSAHLLVLGNVAEDLKQGKALAERAIKHGDAMQKFRLLVQAQGGNAAYVDDVSLFPVAKYIQQVTAQKSGWISQVHARLFGEAAVILGAGRMAKEDAIDHAVGLIVPCKVGDVVKTGDVLFTLHANDNRRMDEARTYLQTAIRIVDKQVKPLPLFYS